MNLINREDFLKQYSHSIEDFEKTNLKWEDLSDIYNDFLDITPHLEEAGSSILNIIRKQKNVHSVKLRIKNPEHLIEKIIRKKISNPDLEITIDNYRDTFTDLIGIRALHLFKEDWHSIHRFITETWNCKEDPTVNFREGDTPVYLKQYVDQNIRTNKHKFGYRSVHYIIETRPAKKTYYAEIQVRTIFEEAWSEIDHTIRYPYDQDNTVYGQFLMILNRLAGSADEMGTFIMFLKKELNMMEFEKNKIISEKENIIAGLEAKIKDMKLDVQDRQNIEQDLFQLKSTVKMTDLNSIFSHEYMQKLNEITKLDFYKPITGINETIDKFRTSADIMSKLGLYNTGTSVSSLNQVEKPIKNDIGATSAQKKRKK